MRVLLGVKLVNGKAMMQPTAYTPAQALLHVNMLDLTAGEKILFTNADTGKPLTFAQVVKASLF